MGYLIPIGAIVTVAGLALLMICIGKISKAKKALLRIASRRFDRN